MFDAAPTAFLRTALAGVLTIIGFALMTSAIVKAITVPRASSTREDAETLRIAPALKVAFVPLYMD